MSILNSNAIRGIIVIVLGMAVVDLGTWGGGIDIDWRPTAARYAVALLAAGLRILQAPVATTSDAAKIV